MKSVLIVFGALLYIICMPFLFNGIHDVRTDEYTQNYTSVTTGAAVTQANVVLSNDLWNDVITSVVSISSNVTGDIPTADNYTALTHTLKVGGLLPATTHSLSVDYEIESITLSELPAISGLFLAIVYLMALAVLGLVAGAIYVFFK